MGIYFGGNEYDSMYIAGREINDVVLAGNEYQPSELLAIGAQVGTRITVTASRTTIYSGRDLAQHSSLVIQLSDRTGVIDRQVLPFSSRGTETINFSDGSTVGIEVFPDITTKFIILASGTTGSALNKVLTVYRAR